MKLTNHHNNANIKVHILDDIDMRKLGFTDNNPETWYFCKKVKPSITFNVCIKKDLSDWEILILDEDFLQHYDYQRILERDPEFKYALEVRESVEDWMKYLSDIGIISGHEKYDYI